jgi:prenyltransferase beta subunit
MLQVARLSPKPLGDARDLVQHFLLEQRHPDGGFQDRSGDPDLYYTVFGLEGLVALRADPPIDNIASYLRRFGSGDGLDFVHVACLARTWATVGGLGVSGPGGGSVGVGGDADRLKGLKGLKPDEATCDAIAARLETFRSADGGYAQTPGEEQGTIYAAFLALGAYQDLQREMPDAERLLPTIAALRAPDGGYANFPGMDVGLTSTTAAAVAIHRVFGRPIEGDPASWLLARYHAQGGFVAAPEVPIPDLLSTATALHALAILQAPLAPIQDSCLDFVDTLWTNRGGFYGSWADDTLDCEYTYYGLLALGHLTL